ncbi:uncharacterized protein LOC130760169 [Actinidia eriantha]|uniref:uncharacterized protein LOC130760169 n=1 Tax=Actinidia eriantha TaxID=165200 RepID=UPI0025838D86|nr:uncharacterized protein LOC130760169 [Actinidia eriantha]
MADNCTMCLLGTMDRLWFHQIIVFSEPTSLILTRTLEAPEPTSETLPHLSSNISHTLSEEEASSETLSIITSPSEDDCNNQEDEPPTRSNRTASMSRSCSSSPLDRILSKRKLHKSMSCQSSLELELEEVKGFMDLGFEFSKEHLSPRMMSVIPGLQRLELVLQEDEERGETEGDVRRRPYLSEAWLIKRPDSPLLNLRLPRVSAAADMKKHLRCWARTVASVIQQES